MQSNDDNQQDSTAKDQVPQDQLLVLVPSDSPTQSSALAASAVPTAASPTDSTPQTIQFSHTTTPEDYGPVQDKSFVILDANSTDEAPDGPGHEGVSMQNNTHEAIIVMESGEGDPQWYNDGDNHDLKRVKVYELQGSRWVDQGTAFCTGHYDEAASEAMLIARAESDFNNVILQTTIRPSDVYQQQQDTLIVWTEPDGVDYALSFQDPEGCAEVWNFILEVQRIHSTEEPSSPFPGPEPTSVTTAQIIRSGHLPSPALGIIPEIDRAIKQLSRTASIKEKICEYIQRAEYLKALIDVFHQAEDLESIENLHPLCVLTQTILMMNDHSLYEHILEDDVFVGVIGMLEYDPEFPNHKANYRQFLAESSHYRQPIPVHDPIIEKKIHHTYRLQFLKDVVLARAFDDSTLNVLNSLIIFNQVDILLHVQNDERFMQDISRLFLKDPPPPPPPLDDGPVKMDVDQPEAKPKAAPPPVPSTSSYNTVVSVAWSESEDPEVTQRRREVVMLVQQICIMGKNVQLPTRMQLFKMLTDRGILHSIHWAFSLPEEREEFKPIISVAGEVLMMFLEHDVNGVREQIVRQCDWFATNKAKDESLITLLSGIVVKSKDLAIQTLVGDAVRLLLELPDKDNQEAMMPAKLFSRPKDEAKVERFLDYFYKLCIHSLMRPLLDIPVYKQAGDWVSGMSRLKTNLYLSLCDLLSTVICTHSFRSHFFLLTSSLSSNIATLLFSRDRHLRLAALRYFRMHLKNNNKNFLNHLVKIDIFRPIVDLAWKESRRDTLLGSCCMEFFEFVTRENHKEIIHNVATTQEAKVKELMESRLAGPSFRALFNQWEKNTHPETETKPSQLESEIARRIDMTEENYFNGDDDEDEIGPMPLRQLNRKRTPSLRGNGSARPVRPARPTMINLPRMPPIGALVDYGEEEEEGGADGELSGGIGLGIGTGDGLLDDHDLPPRPGSRLSKRSRDEDEDEDDVLDKLVGLKAAAKPFRPEKRRKENDRAASPAPGAGGGGGGGGDAEFVNGLIAKATKGVGGVAPGGGGPEHTHTGPKRLKLKLGPAAGALASAKGASEPGTKDGDTG